MSKSPFGRFSAAQQLKFALWSEGMAVSAAAGVALAAINRGRPLTPADYASTSGLILRLEDDVWVNAPIAAYNPNFVLNPPCTLEVDGEEFFVQGSGLRARATIWLPPEYHGENNRWGEPYNSYAYTHADRVRVSPIEGCALTCTFCDLPYEFPYRKKRIEGIVDAIARARADTVQPAHHVLISGGTPRPEDYHYLRDVYEAVLGTTKRLPVDIMMAPMEGLLDIPRLAALGVHELSINLEVWDEDVARRVMPRKHAQGRGYYLDFIADSVATLGPGRVRSMLIVGLEPMESTLEGVDALAARGAVPVLSPFRPDPSTPLSARRPPSAAEMEETYLRARQIVSVYGVALGPTCTPCTHNTLTLVDESGIFAAHGDPRVVSCR